MGQAATLRNYHPQAELEAATLSIDYWYIKEKWKNLDIFCTWAYTEDLLFGKCVKKIIELHFS